MNEYTKLLKEYIGQDRKVWEKNMFKIMGTIWRGVQNKRFTLDEALDKLKRT